MDSSSLQLFKSEIAGRHLQLLSPSKAHIQSIHHQVWLMFSSKSLSNLFSVSTSIILVQGTICIFLGYHKSLLTDLPITILVPSNLLSTQQPECMSNHNLIMSFLSLKIFQLLPVDFKIKTNSLISPTRSCLFDPCCCLLHPPAQLSPCSLCFYTGSVSNPWACQTLSCHRLCFCCSSAYSMHPSHLCLLNSHLSLTLQINYHSHDCHN